MPSGALRRAARLFPADFRWKCGKLRGCAKNVREGTLFGNSLLWYHGDKGRIDSYSAHMLPWSVTATQSTAAFHLPLPGLNSRMRTACTLFYVWKSLSLLYQHSVLNVLNQIQNYFYTACELSGHTKIERIVLIHFPHTHSIIARVGSSCGRVE